MASAGSDTTTEPHSNAGVSTASGGAHEQQGGSPAGGSVSAAGSTDPNASGSGGSGEIDVGGGGGNGGGGGIGGAGGMPLDIGPAARAACTNVCSATKFACADLGGLGPLCQNDCADTFAIQNGVCTDLGVEMLSCILRTVPTHGLEDCWIRFYDISQQCHAEVAAYGDCAAESGGAAIPSTLCAQVSRYVPADATTSAAANCKEDRKCLNGLNYSLECSDDSDGQSNCACKLRDKPIREFYWQGPSADACTAHLEECRALASSMFTPMP